MFDDLGVDVNYNSLSQNLQENDSLSANFQLTASMNRYPHDFCRAFAIERWREGVDILSFSNK